MKRRLHFAVLGLALLCGVGCKRDAEHKYGELNLEQSVQAHRAGALFFDVNTDDFRKKNGMVAGATLLDSSSRYDLAKLPADKDKQLVFYCTSPI